MFLIIAGRLSKYKFSSTMSAGSRWWRNLPLKDIKSQLLYGRNWQKEICHQLLLQDCNTSHLIMFLVEMVREACHPKGSRVGLYLTGWLRCRSIMGFDVQVVNELYVGIRKCWWVGPALVYAPPHMCFISTHYAIDFPQQDLTHPITIFSF